MASAGSGRVKSTPGSERSSCSTSASASGALTPGGAGWRTRAHLQGVEQNGVVTCGGERLRQRCAHAGWRRVSHAAALDEAAQTVELLAHGDSGLLLEDDQGEEPAGAMRWLRGGVLGRGLGKR